MFLGREIGHRRTVSEHTARLVDQEVKRKLDEAHEKARELLEKNKDLLETIAQALLDRETLDRTELEILESGGTLPPLPNLDDEPITLAEPARPNPVEQSAPSFGLPGGEGLLPGPAPGYHESDGVSDDD